MAYETPGHSDLETLANYFWNIALCQSFYPCLGSLEVVVRNSIHATLTRHYDREDWYDLPNVLQARESKQINYAKSKIKESNKQIVPGRVIAALTFGFWTSLLDGLYGNSPKGPQIWRSPNSPLLISAFPYAPGFARGVRKPIFNRLDDIRLLRNRIFHYERVYHGINLPSRKRKTLPRHVSIVHMHNDILDLLGWIDPVIQDTIQHLDTFTQTHQHGYAEIKQVFLGDLTTL